MVQRCRGRSRNFKRGGPTTYSGVICIANKIFSEGGGGGGGGGAGPHGHPHPAGSAPEKSSKHDSLCVHRLCCLLKNHKGLKANFRKTCLLEWGREGTSV